MIRLLMLFIVLLSMPATAHEARPAYIEVKAQGHDQYEMTLRQSDTPGQQPWLRVQSNCKQVTEQVTKRTATTITQTWVEDCSSVAQVSVTVGGLEQSTVDALVHFIDLDGATSTFILAPNNPTVVLTGADTPRLPAYFVLGIEHLLLGYDHVLFVIGLMLLIKGGWKLVQTITSFTVAHSITLGLATLDIVRISPAPVEAAIALSILYLAVEIVNGDDRPSLTRSYPWLIAFAFGLLHGLGFAGVLREIGLPEAEVGTALLLFNIGIEVGQLIIVGFVISFVYLGRRLMSGRDVQSKTLRLAYIIPAYAIGGISSFWLIQRMDAIVSQVS